MRGKVAEVKRWVREKVATLEPEQITAKGLTELGIVQEYTERFGAKNVPYIVNKMRIEAGLKGPRKNGLTKDDAHNLKAAMSANFIAFAPGIDGKAFDSVEDFKKFVDDNRVYKNIYLFRKVPVDVKVSIDIGA
jgi:hypothetical protein